MESPYPIRLCADHQYAVLDRVASADVPENWPLVPLVPQGFENEAHLLPALIPLQEMSAEQQVNLLEALDYEQSTGNTLTVATFLASEVDVERMRLHWVNRLMIQLPSGGRALLRSYDPRVFLQLQWMMAPGQMRDLFGPISQWTVYAHNEWHRLSPPAAASAASQRLTLTQNERLERIGCINQILPKIPIHADKDYMFASRAIDALLAKATKHGLHEEADLIAFALHGMTVHQAFDEHPAISQMLAELDRKEQSYADAAALIDEKTWEEIAADLNNNGKKMP